MDDIEQFLGLAADAEIVARDADDWYVRAAFEDIASAWRALADSRREPMDPAIHALIETLAVKPAVTV